MPQNEVEPYVLVVEDHPLVADSLVSCIRMCSQGLRVFAADSLRAATEVIAQRQAPVLIVTDLTLPDSNGAGTVTKLRGMAAASFIVVFSAVSDAAVQKQVMDAGATCYLMKSASIEALRTEICKLIEPYQFHVEEAALPGNALSSQLTQKQMLVLEELAAGRSNKEIAERLDISVQTVSSHVKEILGRLAVKNRTEAVILYFRAIQA